MKTTATVIAACIGAILCTAAAREVNVLSPRQIDARIRKHRTAEATLTVTYKAGKPLANAEVTVRQMRHKFLFGCNAYMLGGCRKPALEKAYRKQFAELLNFATLPFYWGAYEREGGKYTQARLEKMAQWCRSQGIRTKGHPLCWHQVPPRWLAGQTAEQVEAAQWRRITREVKAFAGKIDTWDVVNEAVVMPGHEGGRNPIAAMCKRLGRVGLVKQAFARARKANPSATLLLNDFITDEKYVKLLQGCLDAGVTIDVIGIQSHMHRRYWGAAKAWSVCERFAKFRKPLHFTELTILSGRPKTDSDWQKRRTDWHSTPAGEQRQAKNVAELYTLLFSHPAVEAITWWDFADLGSWQGAPAGLVRKDMTPKPAYEALTKLIKGKWWTGELKLTTDAAGKVRFRGYLGAYRLTAAKASADFNLDKAGKAKLTVQAK